VEYCDFTDPGYSGLPYTWDNKQVGRDNVKARLDRVFGDDRFLQRFGATHVKHLQTSESDHCALLVEVAGRPRQRPNKVLKPFQYENMWHRDPSYVEQVNSAWAKCGPGLRGVQTSLRNMQSSLQLWDKEVFGSVRNNLKKLQFQLEAVRRRSWRSSPSREEQALLGRISELLAREEVMLRQRSRIQWLAAGDRNTDYFHSKCRERARQSWIHFLTLEDGSTCSDQDVLKSQAKSLYKNLFEAQDDCNLNAILQFVLEKVSTEMNNFLCRPFDPSEIDTALFMMKPNKSLGTDGFTAGFSRGYNV
jgi:hypothetical protein